MARKSRCHLRVVLTRFAEVPDASEPTGRRSRDDCVRQMETSRHLQACNYFLSEVRHGLAHILQVEQLDVNGA